MMKLTDINQADISYMNGYSDGYRMGSYKTRREIFNKISRFILNCIEVCCMILLYVGMLISIKKDVFGWLPVVVIPINIIFMLATHIFFNELRGECNAD